MGNVASWSGTKTLTCFQYFDEVMVDLLFPGQNKSNTLSVNFAKNGGSLKNKGKDMHCYLAI